MCHLNVMSFTIQKKERGSISSIETKTKRYTQYLVGKINQLLAIIWQRMLDNK